MEDSNSSQTLIEPSSKKEEEVNKEVKKEVKEVNKEVKEEVNKEVKKEVNKEVKEEVKEEEALGFVPLPRDESDPRFVQSFSASSSTSSLVSLEEELSAAVDFFEAYGFVVFRDVFSREECEQTRSSMWDIIEKGSPGFDRDNRDTWSKYSSAGKYGLSMRGPCFHPTILNNRQNPNLIRALESIIGSTDIMVSHDRFTIYRATENDKSFTTGDRNVHLDISPWWWSDSSSDVLQGLNCIQYKDSQDFIKENNLVVKNMGRHLQCVLNFEDNEEVDGGTILVPRFHKYIEQWCSADAQQVLKERKLFKEKINLEKQQKNLEKKLQKEQRRKEKELEKLSNASLTKSNDNISPTTTSVDIEVDQVIPPTPSESALSSELHNVATDKKSKKKSGKGPKQLPPQKPDPVMSHSGKWGSEVHLQQPLPWVIMSDDSMLLSLAQRVPMRAGSVLMWDQTIVHGTQPNDGSSRCRMAMFLKAFDRTKSFVGPEGEARRQRRRSALRKCIVNGLREFQFEASSEEAAQDISNAAPEIDFSSLDINVDVDNTKNDTLLLDKVVTPLGRGVFDI